MYTLYKQASVERNHLFLLQHYKRNLAVYFAEKWCSKASGRLANRIGLSYLFSAEKKCVTLVLPRYFGAPTFTMFGRREIEEFMGEKEAETCAIVNDILRLVQLRLYKTKLLQQVLNPKYSLYVNCTNL